MDKDLEKMFDLKIEQIKRNALAKQFDFTCLKNSAELIEFIRTSIPAGSSIGLGGSQTLIDSGLLPLLYQMDFNIYDRYKDGLTAEEKNELHRDTFHADYYLTSSNAITTDCSLYNIDGTGNRVASMIFGPKHVYVICGLNKIFDNEQSAIDHVRNVAAVANCLRLHRDTPCTKIGYCVDCNSEDRICSSFVRIARSNTKNRIHIIIVKENLGY